MQTLNKILQNELDASGGNVFFGLANMQGLLPDHLSHYRGGISVVHRLENSIIDKVKEGPTHEYLSHYNTVNMNIASIINRISQKIEAIGLKVYPCVPTHSDDKLNSHYKDTLRSEISHKMVATRAGLGWIGKSDLLVTYVAGTRVRLGSILVNCALKPECIPQDFSQCGSCAICVRCCPAQAAKGLLWDINTDRDSFFDAHKCRKMCQKLCMERLGLELSICGICVAVCPKYLSGIEGKF